MTDLSIYNADHGYPIPESTGELLSEGCTCCPEHSERMRRMEERVRDLAVAVESFMATVEPAMRMIGQPGGIASLLFKRK